MLETNLAHVRARIDAAAARVGRDGASIALVAVTKSVDPGTAADLVRAGQTDLGENRLDELEKKARHLAAAGLSPHWHFLGHVQRNKVRRVVALASSIHSVDSARILAAIDDAAGEIGVRPEIWIQVKLSSEPTKTGLPREEVRPLFEHARTLANVRVAGLMAIAPLPEGPGNEAVARAAFRELALLARDLARGSRMGDALEDANRKVEAAEYERAVRTSMGMSGDFEWAIEEGSDLVRIGTLLFEGCADARGRTS